MAGWRFLKLIWVKEKRRGRARSERPRRGAARRRGNAAEGRDLTIERGGRRVVAGLSFEAPAGWGAHRDRAQRGGKTSLLRALAGFLPIESGGFALEGGDAERTVGEQAHYLGHADGVKAALTAGENLAFAAEMLGGDLPRAQLAALRRLAWPM